MKPNTEFTLMYRDAANYKYYEYVVLEGRMSQEQYEFIRDKLIDRTFIIADQVGLPTPSRRAEGFPSHDWDHIYTTVLPFDECVTDVTQLYTDAPPTFGLTVDKVVEAFRSLKGWDGFKESIRLGFCA